MIFDVCIMVLGCICVLEKYMYVSKRIDKNSTLVELFLNSYQDKNCLAK